MIPAAGDRARGQWTGLRLAGPVLLVLASLLLLLAASQSLSRYAAWARAGPLAPAGAVERVAGPASRWLPGVLAVVPPDGRMLYAAETMRDVDWLAAYYLYPRALEVVSPTALFADGRLAPMSGAARWLLANGRLLHLPEGRPVALPAAGPPSFPPGPVDGRGWLALLLTAAAATGAGGLLLRVLSPSLPTGVAGGTGPAGRAGLALICGLGSYGALGAAAGLAGVWGTPWLGWTLTAAGLAGLPPAATWIRAGRVPAATAPQHTGQQGWQRAATVLLAALLLVLAAAPMARAVGEPMLHWDERFQWAYKAKILLHEGGIHGPTFQDPRRPHLHRRYPVLIPALEAHLATLAGGWQERAVKGLFPLFFAGLLLAAHGAFRLRLAPLPALVFTALLAALPPFHHASRIQGGPAHTGFADLPLAAFLTAATLLILAVPRAPAGAGTGPGPHSSLPALGLVAGFALLTKPEGIAIAAAILVTALRAVQRTGSPLSRRSLSLAGGLLLLLLLPRLWLAWQVPTVGTVGYTGDEAYLERLTPSHLAAGLAANLVPAALAMAAAPFTWRWACVGLLPVVGLLATRLTGHRGPHALLLLLAIPLAADLLAFVVTGSTIRWHLGVALDRLWMQVIVPLLLMAAGQASRLLGTAGSR